MSPPRDDRATNVNRITFTAPTVAAIVAAVVGIVGAQYLAQSGMRSDIRDIKTQIEAQKENIDLKLQLMKAEIEKAELRKALLDELKANP